METRDLILIEHFCANHELEFSFIDSLHQFGLIEVIIHEDNKYIHQEQLNEVEKMMRMFYEESDSTTRNKLQKLFIGSILRILYCSYTDW